MSSTTSPTCSTAAPGGRAAAWLRAGKSDTTDNCEAVKTASIGSDG